MKIISKGGTILLHVYEAYITASGTLLYCYNGQYGNGQTTQDAIEAKRDYILRENPRAVWTDPLPVAMERQVPCRNSDVPWKNFRMIELRDANIAESDANDECDISREKTPLWAWWTCSSGRIEIQMLREHAIACSQSGENAEAVAIVRLLPYMAGQLATIDADVLRSELSEYGAWDVGDLEEHEKNLGIMLWIAANDIVEGNN